MKVKYTDKQKEAIYKSGSNILVAAAAGSGKTAVLTERIVQKIIDINNPQSIDSLLIVTFTDAATSEMRQRISSKLEEVLKEAEKNDPIRAEYISNQISLINKSYISTIDSFCMNVVRKNFNLLDIDPNFKIIDNHEEDIIKDNVLDDLLEELYEKNDDDFVNFINFFSDNYSKNTDSNVKKIVFEIYKLMQSMPDPLKWLSESVENFNIENHKTIFDTIWIPYFVKELMLSLDNIDSLNSELLYFFSSYPNEYEDFIDFFSVLSEHTDFCRNVLNSDLRLYDKILQNKFNVSDITLSFSKKNPPTDKIKKRITNTKRLLKEALDKFYNEFCYLSPKSQEMMKNTYPIMKTLKYLLQQFSERVFQVKKRKFTFSFNDISHFTLKVLSDENSMPSNVAKEFQKKFSEIIMDEYQDCNELQEAILSLISNNFSNRFMVGDIKQCIYGFRLANPKLFSEKYDLYSTESENNILGYKIDLFDNFRSRKCVLSAVNFIFKQIMTKDFCNIEYDQNAMLHYGADYPEPPVGINISDSVEFELVNTNKNDSDNDEIDDDIKEFQAFELEALVIANKIEYMLNTQKLHIYDKNINGYRLIQYKDIAVLSRSSNKIFSALQTIFTRKKIPFSIKVKSEYFNSIEIATILSFLSVLDNPYQDVQLFTVLHSPVYSFSFDELVKIRVSFPEMYFYAMIFYITPENKNPDSQIINKINIFLRDFEKWKEFSLDSTINELLQLIYDDTDYYNYVGILPDGDLRRMNLKVLQEKAIQFEYTNSKGLFKFMKYIEKIRKTDVLEDTDIFYENDNVVTVTNIHQSKGLEYPVVFVCGLSKGFNFSYSKPLVEQELGIGAKFKDIENNVKYNTLSQRAILFKRKNDITSEEIRLLYVALTRAKEKLILTGNLSDFESSLTKFVRFTNTSSEQLPLVFLEKSSSFLQLIAACLARHKEGVSLREYFNNKEKINSKIYNDSSVWKVNITDCADLSLSQKKSNYQKEILYNQLSSLDVTKDYSGFKNEIQKKLSWVYPNCELQNIPFTISISEIKRRIFEEDEFIFDELPVPDFVKDFTGLSSAQRGTAVHTLLEHIDFSKNYDFLSLKSYLYFLIQKNVISKQEADSINIKKILAFLSSDIAKRIQKSNSIHREAPFVMGIQPSEVFGSEYQNIKSDDMLIHGIIDLYFQENDYLVLVDYKTDYIKNNDVNSVISKYKIQIQLYKKALELSTGKNVKEFGFYLFGADSYVKIN